MLSSRKRFIIAAVALSALLGFSQKNNEILSTEMRGSDKIKSLTFKEEVDFLNRFTNTIVLQDKGGKGKVAVCAALQGRVMTSTSNGDAGMSYGWINREAFLSGDTSEHINVYGGEDRIWLGPEGGQFSIYFSKGKDFTLDNWYVPKIIDLEPYNVASSSSGEAVFTKDGTLTNYSGTVFNFALSRKIRMIERDEAIKQLNLDATQASMVVYESINELKNTGSQAWKKESGLLSIWILGMFNPSPRATILIPYKGNKTALREIVNDNYFGRVPDDRLKKIGNTIFFKADGKHRSKIGLLPENAPQWIGSYDSENNVLTIVRYTKPSNTKDYVNSLWEIQKEPYRGDAVNAYNDGPPAPGAKPLGPFYELETSSPAAALQPHQSIVHVHSTYHFKGTTEQLDPLIKKLFGVTATDINAAF
jgi:hypothetical protein